MMVSSASPLITQPLLNLSFRRRNPRSNGHDLLLPRSSIQSKENEMEPAAAVELPPIPNPKRVVLVRHGQSTWNEEGRIQGSSNFSVLTPKGESQAHTSRQMLLSDSFDVCFTSPLNRSKRTAEIIWGSRQEEMIPEPDLREIDLYSFQGLLKHEGREKFGNSYHQWQKDPANFNIDGHYPVRELWARAASCWKKILAHQGNSVLLVAHNAVNQALLATAIGLGREYFRVLLQSNCGVSVLDFTPRTRGRSPEICLNRLNQTPSSPIAAGGSTGRKTSGRIVLVCQGATQNNNEATFPNMAYEPLNMLGVIQSQKTAELLLDLKVNRVISSPRIASIDTATTISEVKLLVVFHGNPYYSLNLYQVILYLFQRCRFECRFKKQQMPGC
ncbi:putative 2-carboxy-D-arabinitol-1-phosphatase [Iris pallida]|uniref:2-carboxy-D-arabinitol-1-phosphatase n=1 Tax=Iris pallida TaxID=29817 RepID=A0AAX6DPK4_IRIPA|nr:putative 2-carboxy-D-arabinitol-1-phosphatase [Iris pallida]